MLLLEGSTTASSQIGQMTEDFEAFFVVNVADCFLNLETMLGVLEVHKRTEEERRGRGASPESRDWGTTCFGCSEDWELELGAHRFFGGLPLPLLTGAVAIGAAREALAKSDGFWYIARFG